jgi:hypothetical protein
MSRRSPSLALTRSRALLRVDEPALDLIRPQARDVVAVSVEGAPLTFELVTELDAGQTECLCWTVALCFRDDDDVGMPKALVVRSAEARSHDG